MALVDFTVVLVALLLLSKGGGEFVADLKADAPWPWEGVGGG